MRRLLSILFLTSSLAHASNEKLAFDAGFFALDATASGESSSISNPSAFRIAFLKPLTEKVELNLAYSLLLADFSGSDLGFGPDLGLNYYFLTPAADKKIETPDFKVRVSELWKPYLGLAFHQRNFQSVKNSFAGFGVSVGVEHRYDRYLGFRSEARYIGLAGSGESEATELGLFFGVVINL